MIIRHMAGAATQDPVDRAHLTGATRPSPPIYRFAPAPHLVDLVERYWIPVWSLAEPQTQSTLQHPVCLIVVSNTYARLYGVVRGLSTVTLAGDGWAVGTMLTPAAGRLILGRSVASIADTHVDLDRLDTLDGTSLVGRIRAAMAHDPASPDSHARSIEATEAALAHFLPIDDQGRLVNELVAWLAEHPDVTRVSEIARRFAMTERTLQRLVQQRLGLSPKWLIQRRRLHAAVVGLKSGLRESAAGTLADLAADLGYTDQAHFTADFKAVTGLTPGQYLADQP